ncbi:MAG: hypothetical protein JXQ87_02280 [Bacteroidia bacterium]
MKIFVLTLLFIYPLKSLCQIDLSGTYYTVSYNQGVDFYSFKDWWRYSTFRDDYKESRIVNNNFVIGIGKRKNIGSALFGYSIGPSIYTSQPDFKRSLGLQIETSIIFANSLLLKGSLGKGLLFDKSKLYKSITIGVFPFFKALANEENIMAYQVGIIGISLIHYDKIFLGISAEIPINLSFLKKN